MTYEYYIASRYRNKDVVLDLANKLRQKGKSLYCFIESDASVKHAGAVDSDAEEVMNNFESIEDWTKDYRVREIFESDMNALKSAKNVILLLPAGKSSHIEVGVAYGLGKHLIMIGEQKETESLYLVFNEFYPNVDSFISSLS